MKPQLKGSVDERTKIFLTDPEVMKTIFSYTIRGCFLDELCHRQRMNYDDVMLWVLAEPNRKRLYYDAVRAGREHRLKPVWRIMSYFAGIMNNYATWEQRCLKSQHDRFHGTSK